MPYGLKAKSGEHLWKVKVSSNPIKISPAVASGVVYVGTESLLALQSGTGEVLWKVGFTKLERGHPSERPPQMSGSPAVVEGVVYVTNAGGRIGFGIEYEELVALDAITGKKRWVKKGRGVGGSPAVADGMVYVVSYDCLLHALQASTGEEVWSAQLGESPNTVRGIKRSPVVGDGVVCVRDASGRSIHEFDAKTGEKLRSIRTESRRFAHSGEPYTIAEGVLYVGTWVGTLSGGSLRRMTVPYTHSIPGAERCCGR